MSEQSRLNQETAEETGNEQEPETSSPTSEKSIIIKTEGLEGDDFQKRGVNQSQQKKRPKSGAKGKLVRSLAVCEESYPRAFGEGYPDNQDSIHLQLSTSPSLQDDDKYIKDDSEKEKEKDKSKEKDKTCEKHKLRALSKGELRSVF